MYIGEASARRDNNKNYDKRAIKGDKRREFEFVGDVDCSRGEETPMKRSESKKKGKSKEEDRMNFLQTNNIRGRIDFLSILKHNSIPRQLLVLGVLLVIFWISALIISFVQNYLKQSKLDSYELAFKISKVCFILDFNFEEFLYNVRDLELLAKYYIYTYIYIYR